MVVVIIMSNVLWQLVSLDRPDLSIAPWSPEAETIVPLSAGSGPLGTPVAPTWLLVQKPGAGRCCFAKRRSWNGYLQRIASPA